MPKVKFIQPWTVAQGDGKGPVYQVGDIVDLDRSYAEKYKSRGLAVDHVDEERHPSPVSAAQVPDPRVKPGDDEKVGAKEPSPPPNRRHRGHP